jgi:hypothetical protein
MAVLRESGARGGDEDGTEMEKRVKGFSEA